MSIAHSSEQSVSSKEEAVEFLAKAHRDLDAGILSIYRLVDAAREANSAEPIKLLEINQSSTASGVMPVYFSPSPEAGIPYASIIVELHPSEWEQLKQGILSLPAGWTLGKPL